MEIEAATMIDRPIDEVFGHLLEIVEGEGAIPTRAQQSRELFVGVARSQRLPEHQIPQVKSKTSTPREV